MTLSAFVLVKSWPDHKPISGTSRLSGKSGLSLALGDRCCLPESAGYVSAGWTFEVGLPVSIQPLPRCV